MIRLITAMLLTITFMSFSASTPDLNTGVRLLLALCGCFSFAACFWRPTQAKSPEYRDTSSVSEMTPTASELNPTEFNRLFILANEELSKGNSDGLRNGVSLLIDSLKVAGHFTTRIAEAIRLLRGALSKHDRADTKGPWNRDLSGYGVLSWKNDLYERDEALRQSWGYIESVNNELRTLGHGWNRA